MQFSDWSDKETSVRLKDIVDKYIVPKVKKKNGINGQKTEVRALIATMVDRPIIQICRLTKGWTHFQMFSLYQECQSFTKNPPALFWKKYKELKLQYGKSKKENTDIKRLPKLGKKSRREEQAERQEVLFGDRQEGIGEKMGIKN